MCIGIVEIWFGIVNGQISSILTELSARDMSVFSFPDDNFSKYQWIFTKLGVCIDIVQTWFGIADGKILSIFDSVVCSQYIHIMFPPTKGRGSGGDILFFGTDPVGVGVKLLVRSVTQTPIGIF